MDLEDDPRDVARLVVPGVVGVGVGTFLGLVLFDSLFVVALTVLAAAVAGQLAGIYLVQQS